MRERSLVFTCPGKVKSLPRHRSMIMNGHVHTYETSESKMDKACIRYACTTAMRNKRIDGIPSYSAKGVMLTICACFLPPKSFSKKKCQEAAEGLRNPLVKPDIDNTAKLVLDALSGVLFKDDKDVYGLSLQKKYDDKFEGLVIRAQWEEEEG